MQKRGGQGVKAAEITAKTGKIISCIAVDKTIGQIIITSKSAQVVGQNSKMYPCSDDRPKGVILMRFSTKGDSVAAVAILEKNDQD